MCLFNMAKTHGLSRAKDGTRSLAHKSWMHMRDRCLRPNNPKYPSYGGRGITISERWDSFENFLADMGERQPGQSLGRIDNDGPYAPDNCRWEDNYQQATNKRNTAMITFEGVKKPLAIWAREFSHIPVKNRYYSGWPVSRIFSEPGPINQYSNPLRESALKIWKHTNPGKKEKRGEIEEILRQITGIQIRLEAEFCQNLLHA